MKKAYVLTLFLLWGTFLGGWAQETDLPLPKSTDSIFYRLQGQLELAAEGDDPRALALGHMRLGEHYHSLGLYSEALEQYNQALGPLATKRVDTLYVHLNNNIGLVYQDLNNFGQAERHFMESIKLANRLKNERSLALSLALFGAAHEKQGDHVEALKEQGESLALFEKLGDTLGMALVQANIGSIHEDLGQFELAQAYFERAYGTQKGRGSPAEIDVVNNLGDTYRKRGLYPQALELTGLALDLALESGDLDELESAHKDLSKTYALMGDFQNAHAHLSQSMAYGNAVLQAQNSDQLNLLQTRYEINKKEAEIQLLQQQNALSAAQQKLLWLALLALATILGVLYLYWTRRRKAELKIQQYRQRTLKAELEKKEVEERNLQREVQHKAASLSRYSLHLSQKNKILHDLANTLRHIAARKNLNATGTIKGLVREIDHNLQQEAEWDGFMDHFKEIHPGFVKKLSSLCRDGLSPAELRLGMLLRLNLSSKEIASILRVTPDSVRVARHRLRKKLPIDPKEELAHFMIGL